MKLTTEWGDRLIEEPELLPLPEYPRPQLKRDNWYNLNGWWEYAITDSEEPPAVYDGHIRVPFSPESLLSGVQRELLPQQTLWYRRELPNFSGERVLLHFGAVDQEAVVYVNSLEVCRHTGGYTPFSADITEALSLHNELVVRVRDYTDTRSHSRGKQSSSRGGIWYTPQSGIWHTVWAEAVPEDYISALRITPKYDDSALELTVESDVDCDCLVTLGQEEYAGRSNQTLTIPLAEFVPWTPEQPQLYEFSVSMGSDRVESYFAMRKLSLGSDAKGRVRLCLNNKPYFQNGVLDQGYWPDGLYTAPADGALIYDIQLMKDMGFNMLRKHIKLEPLRWYYHCDRLGMLVWQDMPNGGGLYDKLLVTAPLFTGIHHKDSNYKRFAREDEEGRRGYYKELLELVQALYNSPCVAAWVPFNEGWGQFDALEAVKRLAEMDGTRMIDHASGWHDQGGGDMKSSHVYFKSYRYRGDKRRAVVLSEFGGYNRRIDGHCWNDKDFGYKRFNSEADFFAALAMLYTDQVTEACVRGLSAAVYTQLSDVEDELNGLVTYDRRQLKLPTDVVRGVVGELSGCCDATHLRRKNWMQKLRDGQN